MSRSALHLDVESRSVVDLRATNAYVYFDHASTDLWLAAYAFRGEEPKLWHPGEPCPPEVVDHVRSGGQVWGWNVNFERLAWAKLLGPKHGWPVPDLRQYRCTMAAAYAMALPGKLEDAAPALGLDILKDAAGGRLMLAMSKPRRPRKGEDPSKLYWWNDPERLQRLGLYCLQDVRTEMACHSRLVSLRPEEQEVWFLDAQINERGVYIDEGLCLAARKVVKDVEQRLDRELAQVTDWAVGACTNTTELRSWLKRRGFDVPSVAKDAIVELLVRDDLPPDVRRALEIRQEGGKASTAKIDAMLARRQADGRMRGNLQYWGASTGRWAGRGAQLQNLPRNTLKKSEIGGAIDAVRSGSARYVEMLYGPPMQVVSDCIRGMIAAPEGRMIVAADFASIEARVDQWLAGGHRALDRFRAYDKGEGPDPYVVTAADVYNVPTSKVDDRKRLVGKVSVLALGFGGGPGAFAKMAKNYNLDIADAADTVWASATPTNRGKATAAWGERGKRTGMSEVTWTTAELIKLAWREANPEVVQFWRDLEAAALEAVRSPGAITVGGATHHIRFRCVGSFLFCQLPSGRALTYPFPKIAMKEMPWEDGDGKRVRRPALLCKGVNSVTRKWEDYDFYGGLACENVTQAVARDVMAAGMMRVERAGYPVVITIHDEVVAEMDRGSKEEFTQLMVQTPEWASGLPIAAEAWAGPRYKK